MRSRKVICDGHMQTIGAEIKKDESDHSFLKYSLLYDSNFWSSRFNEILTNAKKGNKRFVNDIQFSLTQADQTKVLSRTLRDTKSLLRHLCDSLHKIFILSTKTIDNHVLILESGRKCLDTLGQYVVNQLPDTLRYDNESLLSVYNAIDTYMLTLHNDEMYRRLWISATIIAEASDQSLYQQLDSHMESCYGDINSNSQSDRILLDEAFLEVAVGEVSKLRGCKTGMDKLAQIIHVLQYLSTQRRVNVSQQHMTMSLVVSPPVSHNPSPLKSSVVNAGVSSNTNESEVAQVESNHSTVELDKVDVNESGFMVDDDGSQLNESGILVDEIGLSVNESEILPPKIDENAGPSELKQDIEIDSHSTSVHIEDSLIDSEIISTAAAADPESSRNYIENSKTTLALVRTVDASSRGDASPVLPHTIGGTSLGDVFTNAIQWLPEHYQVMIKTRLRQFHELYIKGNKTAAENPKSGGGDDDISLVPVGTELLILRLRYAVLESVRRGLSSTGSSTTTTVGSRSPTTSTTSSNGTEHKHVSWNAEVTFLSAMVPDGEWLLGPSGYALATLSTALQLSTPEPTMSVVGSHNDTVAT